ncbi:Oidioi.mRNA.OKI2018_I69.chr2.g7274.t1.cds [Oikopleura dioica]|uniref:Oidioi.mRNA.OKI2018_I69.chr2.g7274.t1.cds n=1 Tax=Oikopleura dioica TaxID=34765 RepID=A0ABN7TBN8_OIKDI|nr:Oidioi.mRNA.OKI2018_I69.chr2.g7274.t1.cds [Oikopleura dioica]
MGACVSCRTKEDSEICEKRHSTAEEQEIIKAQIEETLGSVIDLTKGGSSNGKGLSGDIYSARSASTSGIGSERSSRGFSDQYEVDEEDDYEDYDQLPAQKTRPVSTETPRASLNQYDDDEEDYDVPVTSPNARVVPDGQPAENFMDDEDYDVPRPFGSTTKILEEEEEDEYDIPRPHRIISEVEEEEDDIYDIPRPLLIK